MNTDDKLDTTVDYTYVEEVFDSKDEYKSFLQIMCFEFEEAIDKIVFSIEKEDVISFRKILHNVVPHLDMLRVYEFGQFLEKIKSQMGSAKVTREEKEQMVNEVRDNFKKIIQQVHHKYEQICRS